jgi:hypothetical protein
MANGDSNRHRGLRGGLRAMATRADALDAVSASDEQTGVASEIASVTQGGVPALRETRV